MAPLLAKRTAPASAELDAATYSAKSEPVPLSRSDGSAARQENRPR